MGSDKKRVLAIDDDASICEFYNEALRLSGYDVECAPSAAKAREALAKRRPDIILMDIMMPEQDGISFTRELRADAKTSSIPIIVISGLADAGTLNDALLFGAVDYMVKPIDLEALKAKIERTFAALERRKKSP
ncbi:MAG: response regulator transcription factor [Elusimicrobia bacterium]|nr:response regulator transcription factor [Elusimicrobiota bacterium]